MAVTKKFPSLGIDAKKLIEIMKDKSFTMSSYPLFPFFQAPRNQSTLPPVIPNLPDPVEHPEAYPCLIDIRPAAICSDKGFKVPETVNHPDHYNAGNIEVIDAIEDWKLGFNLGNAIKYIARAEHKGKQLEDLKKAAWYVNREIERLEKLKNKQTAHCMVYPNHAEE